jgi:hypothetical protein
MAGKYQKFFMRQRLADAFDRYCAETGKAKNAVAVEAMERFLMVEQYLEPQAPPEHVQPMSNDEKAQWVERWKRRNIPGYAKRNRDK